MEHPQGAAGHHHHEPGAEPDEAAMAELLDLDGEVLQDYLSEVTAWLGEAVGDRPDRILDLGAGTGTGTLSLLERFEASMVVAVDVSGPHLERLLHKAHALGVADRVQVVQADLDKEWPALDPVDLVWASNSLHHLADPAGVLTRIVGALRPGGLVAVLELDFFPRFLPDDVGSGLEARCHAALAPGRAHDLPHLDADWGAQLSAAGLSLVAERTFAIDLRPPLPAAAGRYAQVSLRRMRTGLVDVVNADDLAALDALLDSDGPEGLLHRADLAVRTTRKAWIAQRK